MEDAATVDAAGPEVTSGEVADQPDTPAESAPAQPDATAEDPEGRKQPSEVEKRINRLVGQRLERDRRIADLERQLAAATAAKQQPAPAQAAVDDKGPQESDFGDYGQYLEARASWKAEKAAEKRWQELQESQTRSQREAQVHEQASRRQQAFAVAVEQLTETVPDYQQVANTAVISQEIGQALLASDKGAAVLYHLALHPEDAERVVQASRGDPVRAAIEVARLEAKAEATIQARTRSKAPRQGAPLSAAGGVRDDAPDGAISMEEYARRFYARKR
ncbi:MAG: hypothetical protein KF822_09475 [Steroidobacteraceae bacterium]|nr:hypothetical protein [Steroidobacteraceae bacterium]